MSEITKGGAEFVGYEYKTVTVDSTVASMCLDGYESFGWISDKKIQPPKAGATVTLQLKRDRKIANKMELTRLQRNFEACLTEIGTLQKSKTSTATAISIIIGLVGTVFMAGSTFAVTAATPHIALCVLLAIPGFIGWGLPVFLHKKLVQKRINVVAPLIESKYDEIYELCQKGNSLL